jgi:hypothetical protein
MGTTLVLPVFLVFQLILCEFLLNRDLEKPGFPLLSGSGLSAFSSFPAFERGVTGFSPGLTVLL